MALDVMAIPVMKWAMRNPEPRPGDVLAENALATLLIKLENMTMDPPPLTCEATALLLNSPPSARCYPFLTHLNIYKDFRIFGYKLQLTYQSIGLRAGLRINGDQTAPGRIQAPGATCNMLRSWILSGDILRAQADQAWS